MSATPEKVDAVGPTAVLVSPFTASGTAAGVVTLALDAAFAPPRSIVVRAAGDRELTTFDLPRLGDERGLSAGRGSGVAWILRGSWASFSTAPSFEISGSGQHFGRQGMGGMRARPWGP
ncbi:hypothetical protein [Streptomyces sp. NBC_01530]|uniref:hypothetical protein n=1 Tax=Streptomyces sp. NBC_01530 TaxID=2903895 RepID=UPI00386CA169